MAVKNRQSPRLNIPADRDEASDYLAKIGQLRRKIERLEADMGDALALAKEGWMGRIQPLQAEIKGLVAGLQAYAETHRAELTDGSKRQHVSLPAGLIAWRKKPPRVTIRNKDKVLDVLRDLGLTRMIRTISEINKEAMLAEPTVASHVPGVSISSAGEDFAVEPFEAEREVA